MSKRDVNDKSTYSFLELGMYNCSHGKITLDNKSSYTEGKMVECPNCEHKFIWDKFYHLTPRYPEGWYKKRNLPYGFQVAMVVNTPSYNCVTKEGDKLPRISLVIRGAKLKIDDRVNESRPKDAFTIYSNDKQITLDILNMGDDENPKSVYDDEPMTNCCDAPFCHPGWPDADICIQCGEHAEPTKEEEYANNR